MAEFIEPSLLVPAIRNDLNMRALETLAARLSVLDLAPTVLYDFDNVEATALIHLAEQFNVLGDAGWDMADTEGKQRALLQEAVALHRAKGTPFAVRRALGALGVGVSITEWFDDMPPGAPYTFWADVLANDQPDGVLRLSAVALDGIRAAIKYWKNARSHFSLRVGARLSTSITVAGVGYGAMFVTSQGELLPFDISASQQLLAAAVGGTVAISATSGAIS